MTTLEKTIHNFGYTTVKEFATDHARLLLLSKIEEYQNKVNFFEKKYQMKFEKFEKMLNQKKNNENFKEEEDSMEWRFCTECLVMFQKDLKDLNN